MTDPVGDGAEYTAHTPLPSDRTLDTMPEIVKLDRTVDYYLDRKSRYFRAVLGQVATLAIKDKTQPIPMVLVGKPSVQKSSMLDVLRGMPVVKEIDDFSSKAFVSGKPKTVDGKEVQLIDQIKDKLVVTSDLGVVFNTENASAILSKFVRLYDGANFHKADGRGMHSGESELIRFNHIAAIPKFSKEIMAAFAHLGNRIFLLRIEPPSLTYAETVQTAMKILENDKPFVEKIAILHKMVEAFLIERGIIESDSIKWAKDRDETAGNQVIAQCATILAATRAGVDATADVMREAIPRITEALYTITQGQALLEGRNYIKTDDVWLAIRICMDSCSSERRATVLELLKKNKITVKNLRRVLRPNIDKIKDKKFLKQVDAELSKHLLEMELAEIITINGRNIVAFAPEFAK